MPIHVSYTCQSSRVPTAVCPSLLPSPPLHSPPFLPLPSHPPLPPSPYLLSCLKGSDVGQEFISVLCWHHDKLTQLMLVRMKWEDTHCFSPHYMCLQHVYIHSYHSFRPYKSITCTCTCTCACVRIIMWCTVVCL